MLNLLRRPSFFSLSIKAGKTLKIYRSRFREILIISTIPENRLPESRTRTEILEFLLRNKYRKTKLTAEILDNMPLKDSRHFFSVHPQICFRFNFLIILPCSHLTVFQNERTKNYFTLYILQLG